MFGSMSPRAFAPNALTLLNLLSGCLGTAAALSGRAEWVVLFMGIGLAADVLDGLVARALGVDSPLGAQLDSLADVVSFGVQPAALWVALDTADPFEASPLVWSAALLPLFAAWRLARFTISSSESTEFRGLATPAAAIAVLGLSLGHTVHGWSYPPLVVVATPVVLGFLMVSRLPMFSFKSGARPWQIALAIGTAVCLVLFNFAGIAAAVGFYVVLNVVRTLIHQRSAS